MEYWFNRPESAQDADLEEVTRHELYGYDSEDFIPEVQTEEEYAGKTAPLGSLVTGREIRANGINDQDVRKLREWSEENRL